MIARRLLGLLLVVALVMLITWSPRSARADAVVGAGTPGSCTETVFDAALSMGGSITFNCGAGPVTITVTSQSTVSADTDLDGAGLITLSGGGTTRLFVVNPGVTLTLANLTISDGAVGAAGHIFSGGALAVDAGATLNAINCTFSANKVTFGGGGGAIVNFAGTLAVTNSTFSGNTATEGAAIFNGGTLTATNSTFSANSATAGGTGGAISNTGRLTVTNCTFTSNSAAAPGGGAIVNGGVSNVTNSTFSGNSATVTGGAILNDTGRLTVANCTFSGNSAASGGAIVNGGLGALAVTNSTFSANNAASGAAITNEVNSSATLRNTIVAQSISGGNCLGAITDGGHNIDSDGTCVVGPATDPLLDPSGLANHGGPTQTIALQAGSPAINAGDEAVCAAPPINDLDQRGFGRPGTGAVNCSIGAYEFNSPGGVCCQCSASCAAPIDGLCGICTRVFGASCESGGLCVADSPTPTPTVTPTPTNAPGMQDCCQCADFCAAPVGGTCGGCAVVFGASCREGSLCVPRTPLPTPTPTASPTATPRPCVGDCNGNGHVTVDELVTGADIALGNATLVSCPAFNCNGNGRVTVDCVVKAIGAALAGCGS